MQVVCGDGNIINIRGDIKRLPGPGRVVLGLGSAPGVLDLVCPLLARQPGCFVCAMNDRIGSRTPHVRTWPGRLDAALSLHGEVLPVWLENRLAQGFDAPGMVMSVGKGSAKVIHLFADTNFPIGSSGMMPVLVGLATQARAVIVAGVSLSGPYREGYARQWRKAYSDGILGNVYHVGPSALIEQGLVRVWDEAAEAEVFNEHPHSPPQGLGLVGNGAARPVSAVQEAACI